MFCSLIVFEVNEKPITAVIRWGRGVFRLWKNITTWIINIFFKITTDRLLSAALVGQHFGHSNRQTAAF